MQELCIVSNSDTKRKRVFRNYNCGCGNTQTHTNIHTGKEREGGGREI